MPEPSPVALRRRAKRLLLRAATRPRILRRLRHDVARHTLILCYHNVIPDELTVPGPSASAHLPLGEFRQHLDLIERYTAPVPLDDVFERQAGDRPRVAITFDDAYAGAIRLALPELTARGVPATVFVASDFVGGAPFWWDAFPVTGWEGSQEPLVQCRGLEPAVRAWAVEQGLTEAEVPELLRCASIEDLRAASRAGYSFGVHTVRHPNLTRLTRAEIREELIGCRDWIETQGLPSSPWVAYPYGLSDASVEDATRALGFEGALSIQGGWNRVGEDARWRLPRANIPAGMPVERFVLLLHGLDY